jgi:hypothetical protein
LNCAKTSDGRTSKKLSGCAQTNQFVQQHPGNLFKSATALFAQLQIALHNSLQIIFFPSTSNKWLTRREPSSGKSPPPLEPAEKVLNVKARKICGKQISPVGTFPPS